MKPAVHDCTAGATACLHTQQSMPCSRTPVHPAAQQHASFEWVPSGFRQQQLVAALPNASSLPRHLPAGGLQPWPPSCVAVPTADVSSPHSSLLAVSYGPSSVSSSHPVGLLMWEAATGQATLQLSAAAAVRAVQQPHRLLTTMSHLSYSRPRYQPGHPYNRHPYTTYRHTFTHGSCRLGCST